MRRKTAHALLVTALVAAGLSLATAPVCAQGGLESLLPPDMGGGEDPERDQGNALPMADVPASADDLAPGLGLPTDEGLGGPLDGTEMDFKTPEELEAEIRDESFDAALQSLLPLRPEEIRKLLEYYDRTRESVEVPVYPYPKPEVSVLNVSLDPGVAPPIIQVATGHVTTITMLDVTGAPWPIQDISWAGNFEVVEPEEGGHVVRITPMSEFAYGNLSMRLLTLKTPLTFTLRTQRDAVHYRVDARVPDYGPFANAPLLDRGITLVAGDPDITNILDGVPPVGAEMLNVSGVDGRTTAYLFKNTTFVRTPLTLLSPGWDHSVTSADGMNVYAMDNAPVLLLSDQGRMMRAYLTKRNDEE